MNVCILRQIFGYLIFSSPATKQRSRQSFMRRAGSYVRSYWVCMTELLASWLTVSFYRWCWWEFFNLFSVLFWNGTNACSRRLRCGARLKISYPNVCLLGCRRWIKIYIIKLSLTFCRPNHPLANNSEALHLNTNNFWRFVTKDDDIPGIRKITFFLNCRSISLPVCV